MYPIFRDISETQRMRKHCVPSVPPFERLGMWERGYIIVGIYSKPCIECGVGDLVNRASNIHHEVRNNVLAAISPLSWTCWPVSVS